MDATLTHRVGRAIAALFDARPSPRIYPAKEVLATPWEELEDEDRAWTRAYRSWKRRDQTCQKSAPTRPAASRPAARRAPCGAAGPGGAWFRVASDRP